MRSRVGEQGPFIVWGFVPGGYMTRPDVRFVLPHLTGEKDGKGRDKGLDSFWACWNRLLALGLVETVAHLVDGEDIEGEVIHPMALECTGLPVEREVRQAAEAAARAMVTPGQLNRARKEGVVTFAPVPRHMEQVQVVGIVRLRYRPKTSRTASFIGRAVEWREAIARFRRMAGDAADGLGDAALAGC
jgi:hypothetical protein